jgi:peptidyl-dipeptidase A
MKGVIDSARCPLSFFVTICSVILLQPLSVVYCIPRLPDNWLESDLDDLISELKRESLCSDDRLNKAAEQWVSILDHDMTGLLNLLAIASWNYTTYLTEENGAKLEAVQAELDNWVADKLPTARTFLKNADQICNDTTVRLLRLFANFMLPPVANSPQTRSRINQLVNGMEEIYSTAAITDSEGREYRLDPELTELMTKSRDYDRLVWAWQGWRNVTGRRIKDQYVELVEKMNEAARDNGYTDVGVAWQMTDFDEADIEQIMGALYDQIKPLYQQIHAYVRRKLISTYPNSGIDPTGPIPAHLLGDMWAQTWSNIADILLPYPDAADPDITAVLHGANYTVLHMFRTAEDFFTSIGLEPMTTDFWAKSVLVRPDDNRPMTCHGSASDFFSQTDFRIKMCTQINADDFQTVHHEMGHIEYFMQYRRLATLFRTGANSAFHEAVGDTIALSVMTPEHLSTIGLLNRQSSTRSHEQEINFLMTMALSKVVFLPFAYIVDKWRYEVFRNDVTRDRYNTEWWKLRQQYQGLKPPVARTDDDFDPGSKYHVPANVPYSRYFLSFIGQFQFHSALCKIKGHTGPLHTCDIYRSRKAGRKLKSVLSLGASKPWQDAMFLMTGQTEFKADAILEYFQPLADWLAVENTGHHVGW